MRKSILILNVHGGTLGVGVQATLLCFGKVSLQPFEDPALGLDLWTQKCRGLGELVVG